jgi:hypothetical protein
MKQTEEQLLAICAEIAKLNLKIERSIGDMDCELRKISAMSFCTIILIALFWMFQ